MGPAALRAALLVVAALLPGEGRAEGGDDRPSEEELFGAPPAAANEPAPPPAREGRAPGQPDEAAPARRRAPGGERGAAAGTDLERAGGPAGREGGARGSREDAELFGGQGSPNALPPPPEGLIPREKEDTLKVGGQIYLRTATFAFQDQAPGSWLLSSPNLVDVYLDVRPNDRVRGFVLGRLFYDPTILPPDPAVRTTSVSGLLRPQAFAPTSTANPSGVLDQVWINFDIERRAFVTAGRQHAKWGVGRFWNPTDYLHPVKRDPLAVFDTRTGTTLVKVHVPWEARGWNLYGVTVFEDLSGDPPRRADGTQDGTNRLGRVGGGGRAEVVLAGVELGADALVQDGHRPRFGVDFSTGLWNLDLYGEAALRQTVDTPRWREVPGTTSATDLLSRYERHDPLGFTPQIVLGASSAVKYSDEDAVTFGGEYFYDRSGYENARAYPALLAISALSPTSQFSIPGATPIANPYAGQPNPFTSFYLGRHYGGAYASLPSPGSWNDTTFTLSVLGNLSDKSFVARLDHSVLLVTYLRLETYFAGHFGAREGEFRLGFTIPGGTIGGQSFPAFSNPPMIFDAGVAIRVSL